MRILIIGGGGREHALAWKIKQSPLCDALFCAPGNPGIARLAACPPLDLKPPFASLARWCTDNRIGLVVVGPEDPLALGVADALAGERVLVFGPRKAAARLEASKGFAKEIMTAAGIPTGKAGTATDLQEAARLLDESSAPYVIKADGLAAGKGVTIAATRAEADAAVRASLVEDAFGDAGRKVLIEEYLQGVEASLLAFSDGKTVLPMEVAQDYKQALDGDRGPNTGGMGAVSPTRVLSESHREQAIERILKPAVAELVRRGMPYQGVLYAGLMITKDGPKVIEFNCRFGDPETQVILPRMENDLVEIMLACARGDLSGLSLRWKPETCVCVVAASGGYPGPYEKGKIITGLDEAECEGAMVFHAGTANNAEGEIVTSGGRVLGVTALGRDLDAACGKAYTALQKAIRFDGMHYRADVGFRA